VGAAPDRITLDVGNSSVGLGIWTGADVRLERVADPAAAAARLGELGPLPAVGVSVSEPRWDELVGRLREAQRGEPRRLTGLPLALAEVSLERTAGVDRLVTARAALPGPAVIVDAGTAVTVDVVDADGVFLGGFIAPGPATGLDGLVRAAPALPSLAGTPVDIAPGVETEGALSAGAWGLVVGGVDRLVEACFARLDQEGAGAGAQAVVHATGGWGAPWAAASRYAARGVRTDEALAHRGVDDWARSGA